jgi:hypothetical protein
MANRYANLIACQRLYGLPEVNAVNAKQFPLGSFDVCQNKLWEIVACEGDALVIRGVAESHSFVHDEERMCIKMLGTTSPIGHRGTCVANTNELDHWKPMSLTVLGGHTFLIPRVFVSWTTS